MVIHGIMMRLRSMHFSMLLRLLVASLISDGEGVHAEVFVEHAMIEDHVLPDLASQTPHQSNNQMR